VAKQFKSLLNKDPQLRSLLDAASLLDALQRQFCSAAPPYLANACQVTGLQDGTLSISAANGTVAAKLRQMAPEIAAKLQNKGCEVSGIRVKVQVAYDAARPERKPRELGRKAQHELDELSARLGDSPLKKALKKLAGD
jgi:hypothetical protein